MKYTKKLFILYLLFNFTISPILASDKIDDTIDGTIKAKYNTKKIEDDLLPALPDNLPYFDDEAFTPSDKPSPLTTPQPKSQQIKQTHIQQAVAAPVVDTNNTYLKNNIKSAIVVPKGKKFHVKLQTAVSDRTPAGTKISFVSLYPETSRYITIPAGTVFYGKVTDSHPPQLSANGGLIVIEADEMIYKNVRYRIDAKISIANGKKIFLNNIKGPRKYWQNMGKSTQKGHAFYNKMWKKTKGLAKNANRVEIILTPFTFLCGTVVYAANIIASPALALFSKGGSISIPKNAIFTIQLTEDTLIMK